MRESAKELGALQKAPTGAFVVSEDAPNVMVIIKRYQPSIAGGT